MNLFFLAWRTRNSFQVDLWSVLLKSEDFQKKLRQRTMKFINAEKGETPKNSWMGGICIDNGRPSNEAMISFLKCFLDRIQVKEVVWDIFSRFVLVNSKEEVSVLFVFPCSAPSQSFRSSLRSSYVRLKYRSGRKWCIGRWSCLKNLSWLYCSMSTIRVGHCTCF